MVIRIQVLGPGCTRCKQLAANAEAAVHELGLTADVVKVTNLNEIARMGVMLTPGLVIDGEVKSTGRVLSAADIKRLLQAETTTS